MRIQSLLSLSLFAAAAAAQAKEAQPAAVDFETQVWPILQTRCVECHTTEHVVDGGRKKKPKGGVTLDTKVGIEGSKKGKLVVAKKPGDSLLYAAITLPADHDDRMPPAKAKDNTPLAKEQTDLIKTWIEQGARFGKWTGKKDEGKPKDGEQPADGGRPVPGGKATDPEKKQRQ